MIGNSPNTNTNGPNGPKNPNDPTTARSGPDNVVVIFHSIAPASIRSIAGPDVHLNRRFPHLYSTTNTATPMTAASNSVMV